MNSTQQALWSLLVEIGGDEKLFAVAPNLRATFERAIEVLTAEGVIDAKTGRLSEAAQNATY